MGMSRRRYGDPGSGSQAGRLVRYQPRGRRAPRARWAIARRPYPRADRLSAIDRKKGIKLVLPEQLVRLLICHIKAMNRMAKIGLMLFCGAL
jgi:hypothetical protein